MKRDSDIFASLGRFGSSIHDLDRGRLHQMNIALDLLSSARADMPTAGDTTPGNTIGPWQIHQRADGSVDWVVRDDTTLRERHSWRLQPLSSSRRPGTFRIVLLGSSAAGSFGYWGEFTLATVLESKLKAACPRRNVEVVDLACVNAHWGQAMETLRYATTLEPDCAVIYSGNNEAKTLEARLGLDLRKLRSAFAARWVCEAPVANYPEVLHACLNEHTAQMARSSVRLSRREGIKCMFVIPDYNLADWRPREPMPFHLPEDCSQRWYEKIRQAEYDLAKGDPLKALAQFDAIVQLDAGLSRRSHWGRAQALTALGETGKAREAYVLARDAGIGAIAGGIPQVTAGMIGVLRRTFAELDVPFVDMPELLSRHHPAGIPDRLHFLDYCHLSARGLDLLATALAERIISENPGLADEALPQTPCKPPARDESLACLVAAIHNFHHGQPLATTRYWLERSLCQWNGIRPAIEFLADHLCDYWRERFSIEWFRDSKLYDLIGEKYFFFFAKFFYHARFDHDMAELINDVLKRPSAETSLSFQRQTAGLVSDLSGNLLSLYFLDRRLGFKSSDRQAARVGWERRAPEIYVTEPLSICDFPLDESREDLFLHLRVSPPGDGGKPAGCSVVLNDVEIESIRVERRRQNVTVRFPLNHLKTGLNRLILRWSGCLTLADQPAGERRRRHIRRHGYYPVFARLHELRISPSAVRERMLEDTGC